MMKFDGIAIWYRIVDPDLLTPDAIWDPDLGTRFGTLIWDPDLGPRFGTPPFGTRVGTPIWDPDFRLRFGTPI
jgi:hypothetical protein